MSDEECLKLMSRHEVRPTANRLLVARSLAAAGGPLSLRDLEDALPTVDKSNISRALALFRDTGLAHTIEDGNGVLRYELCMSTAECGGVDDDEHVHFFCERCGRTFCLSGIHVPALDLPEGYTAHHSSLLVKGLCPSCARRAK